MAIDTTVQAPTLTAKDFATDQEVRWCFVPLEEIVEKEEGK
jgi:hypothetical protein